MINIFIETLAEALDLVGAVLSIPGAVVLDIGGFLHNLAYSLQNRNNDAQNNGDGQE